MNSAGHYLVVISVAKCSDRHYSLPQISLPGSDLHYLFFTVHRAHLLCPPGNDTDYVKLVIV